jgi:serine/threonine protein kinase/Tfp pilus assembly protein PilF
MVEMASARTCSWLDIDPFVEAYERCQSEHGAAVLSEFLPDRDHPHFQTILVELVRVDLEMHWSRGKRKPIEEYLEEFPGLRDDSQALNDIAYEEYRLRCRAGERPPMCEYQQRFGLDVTDWSHVHSPGSDLLRSPGTVFSSAPGGARDALELTALLCRQTNGEPELPPGAPMRSVAELLISRDPIGQRALGFQVIGELGRGAKSRVYLAQQQDLADRKVVLKVSSDVLREPQLLARLQHTHIVPIYSVHTAPPFQVFCMPYFGTTTLADVVRALRQHKELPRSGRWLVDLLVDRGGMDRTASPRLRSLEHMTYVQGVLWLAARLAEGLEHAHQRGIIHGDIKPANILLSDEGQPLLLDFNLAREVRQDGSTPATYLGGTLPYMPPEQLCQLSDDGRRPGPQSDIYALGVVLCELLTGRLPYPLRTGDLPEVIASMNRDRQGPLPPLRTRHTAITPAEESILRRCLAPDPAQRYASAAQLREDLERQFEDRPLRYAREPSLGERLRKLARRYPRSFAWAMVLLPLLTLAAWGIAYRLQVQRLQEQDALRAGQIREQEARLALGTLQVQHLQEQGAVRTRQLHEQEAKRELRDFQDDQLNCGFLVASSGPDVRRRALDTIRATLARYRALDDVNWESASTAAFLPAEDRARLRRDVSDLCLLRAQELHFYALSRGSGEEVLGLLHESMALTDRAEAYSTEENRNRIRAHRRHLLYQFRRPLPLEASLAVGSCSLTAQALCCRSIGAPSLPYLAGVPERPILDWLAKNHDRAELRAEREKLAAGSLADQSSLALTEMEEQKWAAAAARLEKVVEQGPTFAARWFMLGTCYSQMGLHDKALACYNASVALSPKSDVPIGSRSIAHLERGELAEALTDSNHAIRLNSDDPTWYFNRALVRMRLGNAQESLDDLNHAVKQGITEPRTWLFRSMLHAALGHEDLARRDRDEFLHRRPMDAATWAERGILRLEDKDTKRALEDIDEALEQDPRCRRALMAKAQVLSEDKDRPQRERTEAAVEVLNDAVKYYPEAADFHASRGVLLARLGKRTAALGDAAEALRLDHGPANRYQVAGIYFLTAAHAPEDRAVGLHLLAVALLEGYGFQWLDIDPDLSSVRGSKEYKEVLENIQKVRGNGPKK